MCVQTELSAKCRPKIYLMYHSNRGPQARRGEDVAVDLDLDFADAVGGSRETVTVKEARNTRCCPSQEKFHTAVLRGVRNISEAP